MPKAERPAEIDQDFHVSPKQPRLPEQALPLPPFVGEIVQFNIGDGEHRPLLVSATFPGGKVAGTLFLIPQDDSYDWVRQHVFFKVSAANYIHLVADPVEEGSGVGRWRHAWRTE